MQTLQVYNSRILRIKNAKCSGKYFYMNKSILGDFQICISVPLTASSVIQVPWQLCLPSWKVKAMWFRSELHLATSLMVKSLKLDQINLATAIKNAEWNKQEKWRKILYGLSQFPLTFQCPWSTLWLKKSSTTRWLTNCLNSCLFTTGATSNRLVNLDPWFHVKTRSWKLVLFARRTHVIEWNNFWQKKLR